MKTLLVTDDADLKNDITTVLKENLHIKDIISVDSGKSALEEISKATHKDAMSALLKGKLKPACSIDLILIDSDLPSMAIDVFCKGIRKTFDKESLPVLVITTGADKEAIIKNMQAGANNFLLKPTKADILNKKIAEVCNKSTSGKIAQTMSIFQKPDPKAKKEKAPSTLSLLSSSRSGKSAPRLMGGAYHKHDAKSKVEGGKKAELDQSGLIQEGHYHETVNVIGGGINCFWAKQEDNADKVELYYMSVKGTPTNMHAKTVTKTNFIGNFRLCTPDICPILKRLESEK